MKKVYETPTTDEIIIRMETGILIVSNGEDLNKRSYGNSSGENADSFWE